jgi:hypothetical protein
MERCSLSVPKIGWIAPWMLRSTRIADSTCAMASVGVSGHEQAAAGQLRSSWLFGAGNNRATVHHGEIEISDVVDISVPRSDSEQVLLSSRDL